MKQLALTSNASDVAHDLVNHLDLSRGKKLVFINTAAEVEGGSKSWLQADRQSLVDAGFDVNDYTITDKTAEQLEKDLDSFDVIYVSGGNTFYLLEKAQQSGFDKLVQKYLNQDHKPYIGSSAGSIIAGPDTYPTHRIDNVDKAPNLQGYAGFNLVNFCILPHWGSPHFKELYLNKRLDHAYKVDQVPLLALTDTQYALVIDDKLQIIEVK